MCSDNIIIFIGKGETSSISIEQNLPNNCSEMRCMVLFGGQFVFKTGFFEPFLPPIIDYRNVDVRKNYPHAFQTEKAYRPEHVSDAGGRCLECGVELCSLEQLVYLITMTTYRSDNWGLVNVTGQVAKVTRCTQADVDADKCFYNSSAGGLIPTNDTEAGRSERAYCCSPVQGKLPCFR